MNSVIFKYFIDAELSTNSGDSTSPSPPEQRDIKPINFEKVQSLAYPTVLNDIGKLRVNVWQTEGVEQPSVFSNGIWLDEYDKMAHHFCVEDRGSLVAAARISFHASLSDVPNATDYLRLLSNVQLEHPIASFNRLVVKSRARRQGIAKALFNARLAYATDMGAKTIVLNVAPNLVPAYLARGFHSIGVGYPFASYNDPFWDNLAFTYITAHISELF